MLQFFAYIDSDVEGRANSYIQISKDKGEGEEGQDLWTYYRGNESDEGDSVSQLPCPCKGSTKRSGGIRVFGCKEGMGIYKQWAIYMPI